jgi:5-methylcytosine-specific restriction protein A
MTHPLRRYCPVQTCSNRTNGGLCREHSAAKDTARVNFEWRKLYRRSRWRHLRLQIITDQPFCPDCAAKQQITATGEVHHRIRPKSEAQFYDVDNLMALCRPCHAERTARGE